MDTKTRPLYMLSTRDPPQNKGQIQMESEGLEKDISCKWRPKESRSSNTHISDKIDFETKAVKRDKEGLHNDQRVNPSRRYNNYKCICTQHRSTAICKAMLTSMKGEINNNTIVVGDFSKEDIQMANKHMKNA